MDDSWCKLTGFRIFRLTINAIRQVYIMPTSQQRIYCVFYFPASGLSLSVRRLKPGILKSAQPFYFPVRMCLQGTGVLIFLSDLNPYCQHGLPGICAPLGHFSAPRSYNSRKARHPIPPAPPFSLCPARRYRGYRRSSENARSAWLIVRCRSNFFWSPTVFIPVCVYAWSRTSGLVFMALFISFWRACAMQEKPTGRGFDCDAHFGRFKGVPYLNVLKRYNKHVNTGSPFRLR